MQFFLLGVSFFSLLLEPSLLDSGIFICFYFAFIAFAYAQLDNSRPACRASCVAVASSFLPTSQEPTRMMRDWGDR